MDEDDQEDRFCGSVFLLSVKTQKITKTQSQNKMELLNFAEMATQIPIVLE